MNSTSTFVRDRLTWQTYLMMAWFAYFQSAPGPLMPFLSEELHLSYTVSGLHTSAFAIGVLLVGFFGDSVSYRWGRYMAVWLGGASIWAGGLLLILGRHPVVTITGTFLIGWGILMLVTMQAAAVERHPEHRTTVLVEVGVAAGLASVVVPLLIGGLERGGIGWRGALVAGLFFAVGVAWWAFRYPIPSLEKPQNPTETSNPVLPRVFWMYWLMLLLGIAAGWCVSFWGADFLDKEIGLPTELASTLMSLFFGASVIGCLVTGRLSLRIEVGQLLNRAAVIALGGFLLLWLASPTALTVTGLFLVGLSVGTFAPLILAATMIGIPDRVDAVSARMATGGGLAILIMPQTVGSLADQVGIKNAFGLIFVLLVLLISVVVYVNHSVAPGVKLKR